MAVGEAEIRRAVARRRSGYTHDVIVRHHSLVVDETVQDGGDDRGASPTEMLAVALASCTAITVEMYADRKGWELDTLEVEVEIDYEGASPRAFTVTLRCPTTLDQDQLDRLVVIAGKCPVHRLLSHETEVTVTDRVVAG
jgi:putative redox protein